MLFSSQKNSALAKALDQQDPIVKSEDDLVAPGPRTSESNIGISCEECILKLEDNLVAPGPRTPESKMHIFCGFCTTGSTFKLSAIKSKLALKQ